MMKANRKAASAATKPTASSVTTAFDGATNSTQTRPSLKKRDEEVRAWKRKAYVLGQALLATMDARNDTLNALNVAAKSSGKESQRLNDFMRGDVSQTLLELGLVRQNQPAKPEAKA